MGADFFAVASAYAVMFMLGILRAQLTQDSTDVRQGRVSIRLAFKLTAKGIAFLSVIQALRLSARAGALAVRSQRARSPGGPRTRCLETAIAALATYA